MIFIVAKEKKNSHTSPPQTDEKSTHEPLCENAQGLKARFTTQKVKMHRVGRRKKELERKEREIAHG